MIYIDPSEDRTTSKLTKTLHGYHLLPGLEEGTGADMLIGVSGLPHPKSDFMLNKHIEAGAVLVQVKYELDLIASIIDGRFKTSQEKMIATGARPDQIVLLFIAGVVMEGHQNGGLSIGGAPVKKYIPHAAKFSWQHLQKQIFLWSKRGGIFEHLQLEYKLNEWVSAVEETMEIPSSVNAWPIQQKIALVNDWRNSLVSLPDIGHKKAHAIFKKYRSWWAFCDALLDGSLGEMRGFGSGTIENIKKYLGETE